MADAVTPGAKSAKKQPRFRLPPALLSRAAAAEFLSISPSTLDRMNAGGEVPEPRRLGGRISWSRRELLAWTDHDCPDRRAWSAIWKQLRDRRRSPR